jgi:trimeric autotransporter adhesin
MENSSPRYAKAFLSVALLLLSLGLASCGGDSSSSSSTTTPVSKITVTPATGNVSVGQTQRFFAAVVDVNNNLLPNSVTWTSTATNVATIDANGIATGVAPGTAQISAASGGVTSNTSTLTVVSGVASVTIEPMSSSVALNGTRQFTATALDSSGKPVSGVSISWFCSFSGVATIDSNGLATGVSPGTVTIVASVGSITSQPAVLTVTP